MASNNNVVASEVNTAVANLNDHLATALTVGADAADGSTIIITLAGENKRATMEAAAGDVEDLVVVDNADVEDDDQEEEEEEDESVVSNYTNSNYQAANNSVLVAGSCAVSDPGVHVIVVKHVDMIRDYNEDIDG